MDYITRAHIYKGTSVRVCMVKNARCVICLEFIKRLDDGNIHRCAYCCNEWKGLKEGHVPRNYL